MHCYKIFYAWFTCDAIPHSFHTSSFFHLSAFHKSCTSSSLSALALKHYYGYSASVQLPPLPIIFLQRMPTGATAVFHSANAPFILPFERFSLPFRQTNCPFWTFYFLTPSLKFCLRFKSQVPDHIESKSMDSLQVAPKISSVPSDPVAACFLTSHHAGSWGFWCSTVVFPLMSSETCLIFLGPVTKSAPEFAIPSHHFISDVTPFFAVIFT